MSSVGKKEDILTKVAEYQEKLKNCHFAGEIYIDVEEMNKLAKKLKHYLELKDYVPMEDNWYETALIVLAVNCAYHYYDDEGFWPHFFRLLKMENTNRNQKLIGELIERRLRLLGLDITARTGPFRYVGNILEQCGMAKRYIMQFARILKELKGFKSWDALLLMGLEEFRKRIDMFNCSRYLKDFLMDTAGWKYTLQVSHILMLLEKDLMTVEDLRCLPGYQPGFWDELLSFIQLEKAKKRNILPVFTKRSTNFSGKAKKRKKASVKLSWIDAEKYRLEFSDRNFDVFIGRLPELFVSDFKSIEEQRAIMLYEAPPFTGRIRDKKDLDKVLKKINDNAPIAGGFSVYSIGRAGNPENGFLIEELEFYLLPPLEIKFEKRLYSSFEDPVISIKSEFPVYMNLKGCRKIEDGKKWLVPTSVKRVEGTIKCGDIEVSLIIPIYRVGIYDEEEKPVRYILREELDRDKDFLLSGYPNSRANLTVLQQNTSLPVVFDENCLSYISSRQLLELLSDNDFHINELFLYDGNRIVSTGAVVIDLMSVAKAIYSGNIPRVNVGCNESLKEVLNICSNLCSNDLHVKEFNLKKFPDFHPALNELVFSIFACAKIFDDVNIYVEGKNVDWVSYIKDERMKQLLKVCSELKRGNVCNWDSLDIGAAKVLIPVERWYNRLLCFTDIDEWTSSFSEWAIEIKHRKIKCKSKLAQLPCGHLLSKAWIQYLAGYYERALEILRKITEAPSIILESRDFLFILLLLRTLRFEAAKEIVRNCRSRIFFKECFLVFENILNIFTEGKKATEGINFQTNIFYKLPLRKEDEIFLRNVVDEFNGIKEEEKLIKSEDWLLLLFLANCCTNERLRLSAIYKLLNMVDKIPPSPEKSNIISSLKNTIEVKEDGRNSKSTHVNS